MSSEKETLQEQRCEKLLELADYYEECLRLTHLALEAEEEGRSDDCHMYLGMLANLEAPASFDFRFDSPTADRTWRN